ncbi:ArsC/Spx/MgsR family protein [Deinococcus altitudinis]|uniref:ArsC/Spx/MgsR family protein n=1 Tax=Deinococcus altitudinis TaxID=468914 RepID=UPI003891C946
MSGAGRQAEVSVQMFGLKKSSATRAAERFFKERRVKVIFVDLGARPIAKGELGRFVQKFGLTALLDLEGKAYESLGLAYLRISEDSLLERAVQHPEILKLPLVRGGKLLTYGEDAAGWAAMLAQNSP